jgi:hypothetical protein
VDGERYNHRQMPTRLRSILIIAFALLPGAFGDKKPKMPEVSVVQFTAHRSDDLVLLDGKFKNIRDKPIRRLISNVRLLTTRAGPLATSRELY